MGVAYNASLPTTGLQLYVDAMNVKSYPGTGTFWSDLSGKGNHGAINGCTFSNNTFVFDGTDDFLIASSASSELLGLQAPMTICGWFYRTGGASYGTILGQYFSTGGHGLPKLVRVDVSTLTYYTTTAAGGFQAKAFTGLTILMNTWYFYSVSISGSLSSPTMSFTVDETTQTSSMNAISTTPNVANTQIRIGGSQSGEYFGGRIPMLIIYNRALSDSEVQQVRVATRSRYL